MSENRQPRKTHFELVIELINGLAWPSFAFILLLALWDPLKTTASLVPSIIGRSEVITISGLSIRIGKGLKQKATEQISRVVSELSPEGLRKLMDNQSESYYVGDDNSYAKSEVAELVRMKLIEEIPKKELKQFSRNYGYGTRLTKLGESTREYMLILIAEFAEELKRSKSN